MHMPYSTTISQPADDHFVCEVDGCDREFNRQVCANQLVISGYSYYERHLDSEHSTANDGDYTF